MKLKLPSFMHKSMGESFFSFRMTCFKTPLRVAHDHIVPQVVSKATITATSTRHALNLTQNDLRTEDPEGGDASATAEAPSATPASCDPATADVAGSVRRCSCRICVLLCCMQRTRTPRGARARACCLAADIAFGSGISTQATKHTSATVGACTCPFTHSVRGLHESINNPSLAPPNKRAGAHDIRAGDRRPGGMGRRGRAAQGHGRLDSRRGPV